jgi:hypothetical protein
MSGGSWEQRAGAVPTFVDARPRLGTWDRLRIWLGSDLSVLVQVAPGQAGMFLVSWSWRIVGGRMGGRLARAAVLLAFGALAGWALAGWIGGA